MWGNVPHQKQKCLQGAQQEFWGVDLHSEFPRYKSSRASVGCVGQTSPYHSTPSGVWSPSLEQSGLFLQQKGSQHNIRQMVIVLCLVSLCTYVYYKFIYCVSAGEVININCRSRFFSFFTWQRCYRKNIFLWVLGFFYSQDFIILLSNKESLTSLKKIKSLTVTRPKTMCLYGFEVTLCCNTFHKK